MSSPLFIQCMECSHQQPYLPMTLPVCEKCGGTWLEPHYDYAEFKRQVFCGLRDRSHNIWRYHDILPVEEPDTLDFKNVGWTPLQQARRFGQLFGHPRIYVKDERYGPTSSFKDRQAVISVAALYQSGVRECVIASTGNAAVAYAAACARVGIKLWVFMTSLVPQEKLREAALFGAEVVKVSGTYDQTKVIASEFASRRGLWYDRGANSIPARESMKTIAYEIVEQLGWRAPDWYVQAVSGGLGPLGVLHGFMEMAEMGLIERIPKVAIIQAEGCAPMVQAWRARKVKADPIIPQTRIAILSTGDPGKIYTYLYTLLCRSGGTMESVTDAEAFTAMLTLAKSEGTAMEPASAVAFAGAEKLVNQGTIRKDELVVVNCTGHTFPVEKHVLGDQWRVDINLGEGQAPVPKDGLVSALENLDEKTTTILIIDDNSDDALLVRRFLEAKKSYRVFHAKDGWEGLSQARQRLPDLIITDLTMPEMDGFSVIEELRLDPRTKKIPVIVVSAKDITQDELQRLKTQVEALYQKGSIPVRAFVNQVVEVIEQKGRSEEKDR